jgi:pyruvate/2-oxoglutarate dehydrogenase complex dihydrolipoamide acyltransferase (E2) component
VSFSTTDLVDVTMPAMGTSMVEGTVVAWPVAVGDTVEAEQTICEISTDKIDSEIPSPATGVLAEILVHAGETVEIGTVLARISDAGTTAPPARPTSYSPVVQRIAAERGVDLAQVTGTGRDGRIRKQDVLAAAAAGSPLHSESPYRPEPEPEGATLSRMRRAIGAHMKRSLETAATCTTWMEADMTLVEAARGRRRAAGLAGLTALPIVVRATLDALAEHPALNATLDGERYAQHADVNLGVAVSLREEGLIVPVIPRAQLLGVDELGTRIAELARRARAGDLTADEVRGGTFTITNPGQFGAIMATPVINQPQVAILDLEAIVKRPVVVSGQDGEDVIAIRPQTILGLSWDHRALDGVAAARFLAAVRRRLETWDG